MTKCDHKWGRLKVLKSQDLQRTCTLCSKVVRAAPSQLLQIFGPINFRRGIDNLKELDKKGMIDHEK